MLIEQACALLAEVQLSSPEAVAEVLALPHLAIWAAVTYSRLRSADPGQVNSDDLMPFAAFASVAALRAGHSFELRLPIRNGIVRLPSLGEIWVGPSGHSGWALIRSGDNGVLIDSAAGQIQLPADFHDESSRNCPNWTPVPRVRAEAEGLTLEVILDGTDAFLGRLGPAVIPAPRCWQARIAAAWAILARHHRQVASGLATVLKTLVPLAETPSGQPDSSTSGWAWGAIGLSLIDDEALLAETLVHEFHHLVLAAIEDLTPLVDGGTGELCYVGWRDDPRPAAAVVHGTYAQLGMANYWGRQRQVLGPNEAPRCDIEFARARRAGLGGMTTLSDSPLLTRAGRVVADRMREPLTAWQQVRLPEPAEAVAAEIAAEHRLRWRIAHLRPDDHAVETLADRWLELGARADAGPEPGIRLDPWHRNPGSELAALLELRYRDPARLANLRGSLSGVAAVHLTLLHGDVEQALAGYLHLVRADEDLDAWIGLFLARRRRSGLPWNFPINSRPEIAIAVHERIRAATGLVADPEELVEWLARGWLDPSGAER